MTQKPQIYAKNTM